MSIKEFDLQENELEDEDDDEEDLDFMQETGGSYRAYEAEEDEEW